MHEIFPPFSKAQFSRSYNDVNGTSATQSAINAGTHLVTHYVLCTEKLYSLVAVLLQACLQFLLGCTPVPSPRRSTSVALNNTWLQQLRQLSPASICHSLLCATHRDFFAHFNVTRIPLIFVFRHT